MYGKTFTITSITLRQAISRHSPYYFVWGMPVILPRPVPTLKRRYKNIRACGVMIKNRFGLVIRTWPAQVGFESHIHYDRQTITFKDDFRSSDNRQFIETFGSRHSIRNRYFLLIGSTSLRCTIEKRSFRIRHDRRRMSEGGGYRQHIDSCNSM